MTIEGLERWFSDRALKNKFSCFIFSAFLLLKRSFNDSNFFLEITNFYVSKIQISKITAFVIFLMPSTKSSIFFFSKWQHQAQFFNLKYAMSSKASEKLNIYYFRNLSFLSTLAYFKMKLLISSNLHCFFLFQITFVSLVKVTKFKKTLKFKPIPP